jgi:hypothetical protein
MTGKILVTFELEIPNASLFHFLDSGFCRARSPDRKLAILHNHRHDMRIKLSLVAHSSEWSAPTIEAGEQVATSAMEEASRKVEQVVSE